MKSYIHIFLIALAASFLMLAGCEEPKYPEASEDNTISDINVQIPGTDAKIKPVEESPFGDTIHFNVPYHYPVKNDEVTDITQVKLVASIPHGAEITPSLGLVDLSNPIEIKVEAANGDVNSHVIDAQLKKSSKKEILSFAIPQYDIKGIISDSVVSFVVPYGFDMSQLQSVTPSIEISPRATVSPDTSEPQDFTQPVQYTVTAYDGSQQVYTVVQTEPEQLDYGIGYTRKVWSKSYSELDFRDHVESGMALSGNNLLVTDKTQPIKYYDKETAELLGTLDMTGFDGMCFQVATDDQENIVASNYAGIYGASTFSVYAWSSVNDQPEQILTHSDIPEGAGLGRKIAVKGDINGNAVIMAPMSATNKVYSWYIENGQVTSSSPHVYTYSEMDSWSFLCKAEPTGVQPNDRFFLIEPMTPEVAWIEGGNAVKMNTDNFSWLAADGTYFEFNGAEYLAVIDMADNYDTQFKVFDVSDQSKFTMSPEESGYSDFNVFNSDKMTVGTDNLNATSDIVAEQTSQGNSVYVYMLVTNGGIAKYELTNMDPSSLQ
ncbi:MAG TPA: DUF5018 domain-containing protein [Bacteroidales bacterium]|nr:DUF5018 domain-containing protein [Bacteroidales bacterium]